MQMDIMIMSKNSMKDTHARNIVSALIYKFIVDCELFRTNGTQVLNYRNSFKLYLQFKGCPGTNLLLYTTSYGHSESSGSPLSFSFFAW